MESVIDFFLNLFQTESWPPRWHCGKWSNFHGWLYIISNLLIWASYFSIPVSLFIILNKKKTPFQFLITLFILFILSCGATHLVDAIIFWSPVYRLNALILGFTAIISTITAVVLQKNLPRLVSFKSPEELQIEVRQRKKAEEELRVLNSELEKKVLHRTRDLQKANDELENYTHTVSHDLRSPILGILGLVDLLKKKKNDNQDSIAIIDKLEYSAHKLNKLLNELLLMSKADNQALQKTTFEFNPFIDNILDELKSNGTINEDVYFDVYPAKTIYGDATLLGQVFINLINNAIKYKQQELDAKITIYVEEQINQYCITIGDNGIGFDMKNHELIFEKFKRLDATKQKKGTGLGLAIVKNIVEKHGGKIWAESEVMKGSKFIFTLPKPNSI